jgi:hypothetical protein
MEWGYVITARIMYLKAVHEINVSTSDVFENCIQLKFTM